MLIVTCYSQLVEKNFNIIFLKKTLFANKWGVFECLGIIKSLSVFIMHVQLKTKKKIKHCIILTDVFFCVMFELFWEFI